MTNTTLPVIPEAGVVTPTARWVVYDFSYGHGELAHWFPTEPASEKNPHPKQAHAEVWLRSRIGRRRGSHVAAIEFPTLELAQLAAEMIRDALELQNG